VAHDDGRARVGLLLAPTMAWGRLLFRTCEDRGPGDNCGDLGLQLDLGRTRYLLAGGVGLHAPRHALTLSIGAQRLFAQGQPVRASVAVALGR
jgi:hypothetical protein